VWLANGGIVGLKVRGKSEGLILFCFEMVVIERERAKMEGERK
jgi:hypothetical protein